MKKAGFEATVTPPHTIAKRFRDSENYLKKNTIVITKHNRLI